MASTSCYSIPIESIPESSGLPFKVNESNPESYGIRLTVDESIPIKSNPESSGLQPINVSIPNGSGPNLLLRIKSRISWSSSTEVVLWSKIQTNQSFNVQFQSNQTQNHLVFEVDKPIQNESIPESSGLQVTVNQTQNLLVFDLLSMNQFQKNQIQNLRLTHC